MKSIFVAIIVGFVLIALKRKASAWSNCEEIGGVCRETSCLNDESMPVKAICNGFQICCYQRSKGLRSDLRKPLNNTQHLKHKKIYQQKQPTNKNTTMNQGKERKRKPDGLIKKKPTKRRN